MIREQSDLIEEFLIPDTTYEARCDWCGLTEHYDSRSGAMSDGWRVGRDNECIGLWCGKCNDE